MRPDVTVTWWGHATCTVEDSGTRVLTDPLFVRRLAHLRRRRGALPPPEAAVADVVLLSHLHADHLHVPSLARLAPGTRALLPRGAARSVPGLRRLSHLRFTEVEPGDEVPVGDGGVVVRVVPALHDGRRLPVGPHRSPALGYVVQGAARTYFAGDPRARTRSAPTPIPMCCRVRPPSNSASTSESCPPSCWAPCP
ncbi:MBL fold metallo-hydrolase, partial [Streptomyces spectabilis]|uniref:MBL fold metallo-hydrolase n=1 Tax=Streptomyces spectabilis TaxID=68270 RepID=UPI0033CACD82